MGGQETPQSGSCLKVSHLWAKKKKKEIRYVICGSLVISSSLSLANALQCLAFLLQGALDKFFFSFFLLFQEASRFKAITFPFSQIQTSPASFQKKPKLTRGLVLHNRKSFHRQQRSTECMPWPGLGPPGSSPALIAVALLTVRGAF